jgi:hypothetical protein
VVGLAVLGLLCLGGVGAAFVFYNEATKPDLSTPAVVTREFLTAFLVDRDDARAATFQCADTSGLEDLHALRADIESREKTYHFTIRVSVDSSVEQSRSGDHASVDVDLLLTTVIDGKPQSASEQWQITTRNNDGWRVCGGHEVT